MSEKIGTSILDALITGALLVQYFGRKIAKKLSSFPWIKISSPGSGKMEMLGLFTKSNA